MSNIQPPRVQLNFEPDYQPEDFPVEADEPVDDDMAEEVLPDEVVMPSVVERKKIDTNDIFDMEEIRTELDNMPDDLAVVPDELKDKITEPVKTYKPPATPVSEKKRKVNKNGKPRKAMSEEHKAKLAEARKKAVEARKQKAIERKEQQALEKEEKELLKKQKVKRVQKLKQEVEEPTTPEPAPAPAPVKRDSETWITKKDLENAQYEAIAKYETIRKQRKQEKRQAQMIEQERQTLIRKLQPQTYKYRDGSNIYDKCY